MKKVQLQKASERIEVSIRSAGGHKTKAKSVSRYFANSGYEIVSFYAPFFRNGHSAWDGETKQLLWVLMKDGKIIYESSYPKATRKECIRALEYVLEHGELPHPNSFEMDKIKRG